MYLLSEWRHILADKGDLSGERIDPPYGLLYISE